MRDDTRSAGRSRRRTLIAGVALIALTNAVALGGVAWNRSGEPDSVLKLTQRELIAPYRYRLEREDGGMELMLSWRVLSAEQDYWSYGGNYGSPDWLDEAKLAQLGFDVSPPKETRRGRHYERQLPREVLIVLEFNGPSYPRALERMRKHAAKEAAAAEAPNAKPEYRERARAAAEALKREERSNSRLFAVDAGLDAAALRAQYADRARYAIVSGKVRASRTGKGSKLQGYIESIHNARVNVPREMLPRLGSTSLRPSPSIVRHPGDAVASVDGPGFEATIAFGKRYEPWLVEARSAREKMKDGG